MQNGSFYELVKRDQFQITLLDKSSGQNVIFPIVKIIAFTTERKKMTIVVKNPLDNNRLYAFTKGADEAIFKITKDSKGKRGEESNETKLQRRQVDEFAEQGLRTLVFAMRVLDEGVTEAQVQQLLSDEEIERNMTVIGVSGLADKLQEDVKMCISEFIGAGIKTWIVTGDKDSTAKSIGYETGILDHSRDLLQLSHGNEIDFDKNALVNKIIAESGNKDLMISGSAVSILIQAVEEEMRPEVRQKIIDAFMQAKGFVIYRSSPK